MSNTYLKFLRGGLLFAAVLMFVASILGRVLYRGIYFPGWDILGAAQGQYLIETQGILGAAKQIFQDSRHYQYWTSISILLYTLIPGTLGILYHWELWASFLSFSILI